MKDLNNFYKQCSEILETSTEYNHEPSFYIINSEGNIEQRSTRATRWGRRHPGNGRLFGYGTIRQFGDKFLVNLYKPSLISKTYSTEDEVLDFLKEIKETE